MANWRFFAPSWTKGTSRTHAQGKRGNRRKQLSHRSLQLQPLEERTVFAVGGGPTLLAIIPNEGALIVPNGPALHIAPKDLTFRFDDGQTIDPASIGAIQITRSGPDRILGNSDDVTITPGFSGIGETPNDVIVRFAETLPDDLYQVTIIGTGSNPLRNTNNQPLDGGTLTRTFRLDLGAQITAVVPQPLSRDSQGKLVQAVNQIDIYFNDDNLNFASAQNTTFYELILTQGTQSNTDDVIFNPTSVTYDASADKAVLNFAAGVLSTPGTWRLRVGNNDVTPATPVTQAVPSDPGSMLTSAQDIGNLGTAGQQTQSVILNSAIDAQPYSLLWPGANDEPGHRNIPLEAHLGGGDTSGGIPRIAYNFRLDYGSDPFGNPLSNIITENQKQRTREIFALYGYYLGVQFYETPSSGLTIVTGDIRAVDPNAITGPGGIAGIAGGGLAVMDNGEAWGDSEYGGFWMSVAMHEIGHLLGQGHTYDLPALTIQGSDAQFGSTEALFPGIADIVHGQHLYRPDSKDIDLYRFNLNQPGKVSLETIAERLTTFNNGLDSVITVFDSNGLIVARNDDYFSKDSYLELNLTAGQYFVAVTSTGNTEFDPKVNDSGMLGTTQGDYSLRINFTPDATGGLVDANGTMFDGDGNGAPGGTYNFWFKTQTATNTLFVDKVATGGVGTLGSITNPYTNISLALAAATPGQIVRIVGNGGADGNLATINDNVAYNIGRDIFNASLSDGLRMDIPRNVTVMVDAGTIIKLRGANIEAGSQSSGVDRSGGALQVLGTPARNGSGQDIGSVIITSFHNESVGSNSDSRTTTPGRGDWGGLVFRDDSDQEQFGIFLSYVNHAKISYGGGQVPLLPSSPTYDPIHLIKARPNISFNTITNSSGAAMSADPDSFEETKFQNTTFTADYGRVGPALHSNYIVSNTINGIFVRIRTLSNESIDLLTVPARFDDTDIVHVISENLIIKGNPGGGVQDPGTGIIAARLAGRLKVDPGTIIKLDGARIETQFGAQLIAEGTASNRVIMTSLLDDKYGAGGTFDTPSNGAIGAPSNVLPGAGNWGGLYFAPTSSANFEYALVSYGGGSTSVEGGFDNFNAVEIHQADVRIANSIIENNAGGAGGTRAGRGTNAAATIFTRFSHPVLLNNVIRNNAAAAVSMDVTSLGYQDQNDTGRTTGRINLLGDFTSNQGPLVSGNRLLSNGINGMLVRGGPLTTEGVWDDTDIVHVVQSEIVIPDHHTFSGLRLESNPTQSLIVKLQGATAGFTADGRPLDIEDRIGGTLQVMGRPGYPVVFTSLNDDSVGAGFDPSGKPMRDTNNNGNATLPSAGDWRSLRLDSMSNDRNVAVVNEKEQTFAPGGDSNGIPENAQELGGLAPNEKSGDDNLRLGFEIHGLISQPSDVDVYRFSARAGTEVWLDIDRTSFALDTVVELVDESGAVVGRSDNSEAERANPGLLVGSAFRMERTQNTILDTAGVLDNRDYFTMNTRDAGMRIVLPPGPDTVNNYFVRVRSSSSNLTNLAGGQSEGSYQLQIRLREVDEKPGSVIGFADVRYAGASTGNSTIGGIEILGKPEHSPILSESLETTSANDTYATAQDLGNLFLSDRATLSAGGNISSVADVDWFQFDLTYELVQNIDPNDKTLSAMFDIDYADGIARPDTTLAVFDDTGRLVLVGRDSSVADDQKPAGSTDAGKSDLDRGSFGKLDPSIGTIQLPETHRYFVAVFSNRQLPSIMDATFRSAATDPLIRLEPINSINRIAEDHIGVSGGGTLELPSTVLFPGTTPFELNQAASQFHLGDVPFYVMTSGDIFTANAFTGQFQTDLTGLGTIGGTYGDVAMRNDGRVHTMSWGTNDATSGNYRELSTGNGAVLSSSDDNIVTYQADASNPLAPPVLHDVGVQFDAMTYTGGGTNRTLWAIGHRAPGRGVDVTRNLLYRFDANTGAALDYANPNDPRIPTDAIERSGGARRPLVTSPTILTSDVTDTLAPITNPGDVIDGMTIVIDDGANPVKTFEIDTGPDIRFATPFTSGNFLNDILFRDEQRFTLGATTYEFNSGPVLVVGGTGSNFIDGQVFTITDSNNVSKTFEFDSSQPPNLVNPANARIGFTIGDSATQIASSIVAAINAGGLTTTATRANASTTRITLENDVILTPVAPASPLPSLNIDGDYGLAPIGPAGRVIINYEEIQPQAVVGAAIAAATGGSYARNRVNFPNAPSSNFTGLLPPNTSPTGIPPLDPTPIAINNNVFGNPAAPGVLTAGATRIPVAAATLDDQLAVQIANIINGQTSAAFRVSAQAFGTSVSILPAAGFNNLATLAIGNGGNALISFGEGPGGDVTGLAELNGTIYAVSSNGGLFSLSGGGATNTALNYIDSSSGLTGTPFSGLTAGPKNVENGRYANLLFATDTFGNIYALDPTAATPADILQPIFLDGATSINVGVSNPVGIAFSPIDYNLWHVTEARENDPGHGLEPTFNNDVTRANTGSAGMSFYFGLENPQLTTTVSNQPGAGNFATNPGAFSSYNVPNGQSGSVTSSAFSLVGYEAFDKPTLYFNYYLETQGAQSSTNNLSLMRDAFRVQISTDGANWTEVATNNSLLSTATVKAELARHISASGGTYRNERILEQDQHMQEAFDNTNTWRQARIDLGDWAGLDNLRLRFDFTTSGSFDVGNFLGSGEQFRALPGAELRDGQGFEIDGVPFEFDLGFAMQIPQGGATLIQDQEFFTIDDGINPVVAFEFNRTGGVAPGRIAIDINSNDTGSSLLTKIQTAIQGQITAGNLAIALHVNGNRIALEGATAITQSGVAALIFDGDAPGTLTNPGAIPVVIDAGMTDVQVAIQMADVIDAQFSAVDDPSLYTSVKLSGAMLSIIGHNVTDPGPLPLATTLTSDTFGDYFSTGKGQNNLFEGVYVDDIVIGFAERGEMVSNASIETNFFSTPVDPAPPGTQSLVGRYQLEIRRGTEYATQNPPNPFGPDAPDIANYRSFDTNDRFLRGYTLVAPAPEFIREGETFTLNDGLNAITFEMDADASVASGNVRIRYDLANTAADVALLIVGAVNAQTSFKVRGTVVQTSNRVDFSSIATARTSTGATVQITAYADSGDKNLFRDQGYTIIHDTKVSDSAGFGIMVDSAARTVGNNLPHTGSSRTLTVPSTQDLVPGIAIKSNLLTNNIAGGILFSGDNSGSPTAAVPFGRILNNTIFGGVTAAGIGISVTDRAGPSILNNIIANSAIGVDVDASSGATTVLGANVYQANGTNRVGAGETFAINAPTSPSLFVSAATGNFYLAQGSMAVDSAIDSLPERTSLKAVVEDVGIPQSPILAPNSDLFGQLRKDDDTTPNSGQGNIPFKDRGALERADFDGPIAAMFDPIDNDSAGVDRDTTVNTIQIVGRPVSHFSVQLLDPAGVGVDDSTVMLPGGAFDQTKFTLTRDGVALTVTNDFLFSYDTTNKIARFDAAAGVWIAGTYRIVLNNSATGIKDIANNQLIANNPNGNTEFTITLSNAVAAPWQNPNNALDVNGDGFVSPIDALLVVNALNTLGGIPLPTPAIVPPYIDVNGDGNLSAIDLLLVVAQLNAAPVQLQAAPLSSSLVADESAGAADSAGDDSTGDLAFAVSLGQTPVSSPVATGTSSAPTAATSSSSAATSSEAVWQAFADESFDVDAGELAVASLTSTESEDDWNFENILDG